jgi:hypothetical protein
VGGRGRLGGGAPRLLGRHDGARGRAYRRAFNALVAEFDVTSPLAKLEAGRTALAWTNLEAATESLEAARRAREEGRGRRPSPRTIERLARRQGLANADYAQALAALRELVGAHRQPATIADLVTRQQQRGRA